MIRKPPPAMISPAESSLAEQSASSQSDNLPVILRPVQNTPFIGGAVPQRIWAPNSSYLTDSSMATNQEYYYHSLNYQPMELAHQGGWSGYYAPTSTPNFGSGAIGGRPDLQYHPVPQQPYGTNVFDYAQNWAPSMIPHDNSKDMYRASGYTLTDERQFNSYLPRPGPDLGQQMSKLNIQQQPQQQREPVGISRQTNKPLSWADKVRQAPKEPGCKEKMKKVVIGGVSGNAHVRKPPPKVTTPPEPSELSIPPWPKAKSQWNHQQNGIEVKADATKLSSDETLERLKQETNPSELKLPIKNARFFVIKSYSEDDVHRSIKYSIWCSTEHGNKRLDTAFKERERKGPIYLFFSVNASGHFCGIAQMMSAVDYDQQSEVWAQDKWKGLFRVRWLYVKDVPNQNLRHIRLENNENKPVTNSRDTQEVPFEKGRQVIRTIHDFEHNTSLYDDFGHYEQRQKTETRIKSR